MCNFCSFVISNVRIQPRVRARNRRRARTSGTPCGLRRRKRRRRAGRRLKAQEADEDLPEYSHELPEPIPPLRRRGLRVRERLLI